METVLVTGGAGFIGSNFIRDLLARTSARVVNLDALTYAGNPDNLVGLPDPERYSFVHGDITDRALVDDLLCRFAVDTVVHFAAESHVDRSIHGPMAFVRTNVLGTATLLEAAREAWLTHRRPALNKVRFHHVSTDEVYGDLGPDEPPASEAAPYAPSSPYAATKAASDHLVRAYGRTYGLPVTISSCSNNYGPRQHPEKLISFMILAAVEGRPLPVYGDGLNVRDWLYVEDHCTAIRAVLEKGRLGETYNIGGGTELSNIDLVRSLCGILDNLLPDPHGAPHAERIVFVRDRPGHDRRYALDICKIRREMGWAPRETLQSGLERTVRWYLAHPEWIARVRGQPAYHEWLTQNYADRGAVI
jgi:dTDP-glucose 4,6-dehydratase